jgi:hypothetical protein
VCSCTFEPPIIYKWNECCNISHMLSPEKTDMMSFTFLIYMERLTWWLWLVWKPWNHVEGRHACNVFRTWLTVSEMGKCKCRALKDIAKLRGTSDLHKLATVHGCKHKLPPVFYQFLAPGRKGLWLCLQFSHMRCWWWCRVCSHLVTCLSQWRIG